MFRIRSLLLICAGTILYLANFGVAESSEEGYHRLKNEVVETIRILGNELDANYLDILWPGDTVGVAGITKLSRIPQKAIDEFEYWTERIIQPEWLPDTLVNYMLALKDNKKWELRKDDRVVSQLIGDYLIADYEIRYHHLIIQENGATLSFLVDLPEVTEISKNPEDFIWQCIQKFLKFPQKEKNTATVKLKSKGNIYFGTVATEVDDAWPYNENMDFEIRWWEYMRICTDGHFFFVILIEGDGTPIRQSPKEGLPDRF